MPSVSQNANIVHVQCCFTSTETTSIIRDRESRLSTSTFTQLMGTDESSSSSIQKTCFTFVFSRLCSELQAVHLVPDDVQCSMLLYDHRDHTDYSERGAQDGHLDFHTAPGL